jgi:DNA repair protein RecO (recombination protein O)
MPVIVKAQGIVLNTTLFRETSLFATIFTKQHGKVRILAKGCRRPKSKMCGALERFNIIEIIFYKRESKDTYTISDATIIDDLPRIRARPRAVNGALVLCEFFLRTLPNEDPDYRSYTILEGFLIQLANIADDRVKALTFNCLLRALASTGVRPHLDTCVRCNNTITYDHDTVDFSISGGGIVCAHDHDNTVLPLHAQTVLDLRAVYEKNDALLSEDTVADLERLIPDYLIYHLDGLRLNSLKQLS